MESCPTWQSPEDQTSSKNYNVLWFTTFNLDNVYLNNYFAINIGELSDLDCLWISFFSIICISIKFYVQIDIWDQAHLIILIFTSLEGSVVTGHIE